MDVFNRTSLSIILFALLVIATDFSDGDSSVALSRRKRYLVFPEGSSFSIAFCMTAITVAPTTIWTEGLNWGIAYDLPNDTSVFKEYRKLFMPKQMMQRRHRRDLYGKMELIMNSMGYDGRTCIFRALCETARRLAPKGSSLLEEIVRIVFRFPQQALRNSEPEEHRLYHWAYRRGHENTNQECSDMFPSCPISLVDMALGYYSDYNEDNSDFPFNNAF